VLSDVLWAHEPVAGRVAAQCSAHGTPQTGVFDTATNTLVWDTPRRRVAPGQAVVLYDGDAPDEVVGGGIVS
jgi:tRNA U34 2-thiouridine synthase MnmA/TrmU